MLGNSDQTRWVWRGRLLGLARLAFGAPLAAFAIAASSSDPVDAHPHVWASVHSDVVFGPDDTIKAIRHTWTFDEFYSAMALQGLDTNGDGTYTKEELEPLAEVNVTSLKDFDYFTFVSVGQDQVALNEPSDAWISEKDGIVTLHFTLVLPEPVSAKDHEVKIEVYDPSFFVAFGFAKEHPVKTVDAGAGCTIDIRIPGEDKDPDALTEAFFSQLGPSSNYGSQFAQTAIATCSS
ncbi:DUF1007 family protein [Methyloligella sp. 2.7D]|uniref:DUF1007 family protein n=1 Tax=unclassified Methyloligella TaxID=2625955 RepID=UPI001ABA9114|nr:DUF1007 family protein [Methyloligella sp. GL2]